MQPYISKMWNNLTLKLVGLLNVPPNFFHFFFALGALNFFKKLIFDKILILFLKLKENDWNWTHQFNDLDKTTEKLCKKEMVLV